MTIPMSKNHGDVTTSQMKWSKYGHQWIGLGFELRLGYGYVIAFLNDNCLYKKTHVYIRYILTPVLFIGENCVLYRVPKKWFKTTFNKCEQMVEMSNSYLLSYQLHVDIYIDLPFFV